MTASFGAQHPSTRLQDFATSAKSRSPWLASPRFDTIFFVGNAAVVPIILLMVRADVSGDVLDAAVTALVGGPHLFATFSAKAANRTFRARRPFVLSAAALIPLAVVWLALRHYQVLISMFLGVASLHVLHQTAYLSDLYRAKSPTGGGRGSKVIDYGVIFSSMYPIALAKISRGELWMGGAQVVAPSFLTSVFALRAVWTSFALLLIAWLIKCCLEVRSSTLHGPKTALIALTVVFSFFISAATDADHMGLAFQAMNAWHSMQYLGLVYLLRRGRRAEDHGPISARLSGLCGGAWFYLGNVAVTLLLFAAIKLYAKWNPLGTTDGQNYYVFVLSPLLIHYYLDAFGFFESIRGAGSDRERGLSVGVSA